MDDHEFPASVRSAAARVIVVLTQSWCPDWSATRAILERAESDELAVFFVEYDREPFFGAFRSFKETVFANSLIPYLRYYRDGRFVADGNGVYRTEDLYVPFGSQ